MATAKKLPSGSWRVRLYTGKTPDGKREYKSFTAPTRREAELAAAEYAATAPKPDKDGGCALTLGEAMDSYISAKSNVLSPSTILGYKTIRRNRLGNLMPLRLNQLTPEGIQREINREAETHSPKTMRNLSGLLSATLRMFAPDMRLDISLPQKERREVRIPSRQEIEQIFAHLKGSDMEIPFLLASQCGLRLSEICALTPADIGDGEIDINKAAVIGTEGLTTKVPKSYAGYRTVYCAHELTDLIRARCDGPLVTNLSYNAITSRWPHVLRKLGIDHFRFHDLRHYYASEGLLLNVPPRYMAELMGHSSTDMIDRVYQHTFKDSKRRFSEELAHRTAELLRR